MRYLLDTNICIYLFRGKYHIDDRIEAAGIENCSISEITLAELVYGAENSTNPGKNHALINDFIESVSIVSIIDAIPIYGKEKSRLRAEGKLIGDFDLLIGSTAIVNEMIMVTQNIKEFGRLTGIRMDN